MRRNGGLASFLMGIVGGLPALTLVAAVSVVASSGALSADNGTPDYGQRAFAAATVAFAVGGLVGDKLKRAPDRTVSIGLAARFLSSALVGAVLAIFRQRWLGTAAGGATAVVASYSGWRALLPHPAPRAKRARDSQP